MCRYSVSLVSPDEVAPDEYALDFQGTIFLFYFPKANTNDERTHKVVILHHTTT